MLLQHILAATDESDAGREAVRNAVELASRCSARVTVMHVVPVETAACLVGVAESPGMIARPPGKDDPPALNHLRRWLQADVLSPNQLERAELGVAYGIAGIEICRFAERCGADLVVLGRKHHSVMARLLLGDIADAVARRNRSPSLFVPPGAGELRRVLVALDGSDRAMDVLNQACDFARYVDASVQVVTVERPTADDTPKGVSSLPVARSLLLQGRVRRILAQEGFPDTSLVIRQGDITEEILQVARETGSDLLVLGYHRGGPPGILEAGSTARKLAHLAPCAVLTISL